MEFAFLCTKLATGQETALALTVDRMLFKSDKRTQKRVTVQTWPRQGSRVLQNSCFIEKPVRYSRPVGQR